MGIRPSTNGGNTESGKLSSGSIAAVLRDVGASVVRYVHRSTIGRDGNTIRIRSGGNSGSTKGGESAGGGIAAVLRNAIATIVRYIY